MEQLRKRTKKTLVAILGGLVVLIGLVLVPYPGPGWLIVFAGLAILSTEFEFAERVLKYVRGKYDQWSDWLKRQNWVVKVLVLGLTGLVVITTVWLLNGFGIINSLFELPYDWLTSPLFR